VQAVNLGDVQSLAASPHLETGQKTKLLDLLPTRGYVDAWG
jgi:hypothetical protein